MGQENETYFGFINSMMGNYHVTTDFMRMRLAIAYVYVLRFEALGS